MHKVSFEFQKNQAHIFYNMQVQNYFRLYEKKWGMAFITAIGCYIGFSLFDCVERVDGVVLESSSVSEDREKEDIFLYFIKQRLMKTKWRTCINYQLTRCRRKCVTLRPNKVIKFPKRLILNPESNITHLWPWFCNLIINIMFFPLAL